MKLTSVLCWNRWQKNSRRPLIPLMRLGLAREIRPLALKNKVGATRAEKSEAVCVPQMMALLACLKTAEFDQSQCSNEVTSFQKCYNQHVARQEELAKKGKAVEPIPGVSKLNSTQMNVLLYKWKQPV